jgi:hypothetical protein
MSDIQIFELCTTLLTAIPRPPRSDLFLYGGFLAQVKKGNRSTWKAVLGREADNHLALSGDNRGRELYRTLETTIDYSLVRVRLLG